MNCSGRSPSLATLPAVLLLLHWGSHGLGSELFAQQGSESVPAAAIPAPAGPSSPDTVTIELEPVVVTATRTARSIFQTPAPVNLIGNARIRAAVPNSVSDLFRHLPGLDVAGVGVQQARPIIRGQRGQRVLLLQDAIRLNNSRRQQEFGETPGLVDISTIERVEVVRGPASVLYGTDAIGGAINLISRTPTEHGVRGVVGYSFGSAADLHRGTAHLFGRFGALDLQLNTTLRQAGEYTAPAGTFGGVTLDSGATVFGTGVRDNAVGARIGYRLHPRHDLFIRADQYEARDAGYGFVLPSAYEPSQASIDVRYPAQTFRKLAFGYGGSGLGSFVADRLDVVGYVQENVRDVAFSLHQSLGPSGASIDVQQANFSDVATVGFRLEAKRLAQPWLLLTYGVETARDRSENSDSSITNITGFGAPRTIVDRTPQVPNATFRTSGVFVQGELAMLGGTVVLGSRVQEVRAETLETEGLPETFRSKSNRTVVGSANAIYPLTDHLSVIGTVGRAFRSPNLIEWFFHGLSTDGQFFQARNPDLEPETSVNVDLGLRYRRDWLSVEGFTFRNRIRDGIRTVRTDELVNNRTVYRNQNIDRLIFRGLEVNADLSLPHGFGIGGGYSRQEAKDARDANIPVGDLYSSKVVATLRYRSAGDRFFAEYDVRSQGDQRDTDLVENPIGDVLPGFTVHHLRGGVTVLRRGGHEQRLGIIVGNLTDRLYAEAANGSFFRPEPGRHLVLSWEVGF